MSSEPLDLTPARIRLLLRILPADERRVAELVADGLTAAEVAARLGLSVGRATRLERRAMRRLRERLAMRPPPAWAIQTSAAGASVGLVLNPENDHLLDEATAAHLIATFGAGMLATGIGDGVLPVARFAEMAREARRAGMPPLVRWTRDDSTLYGQLVASPEPGAPVVVTVVFEGPSALWSELLYAVVHQLLHGEIVPTHSWDTGHYPATLRAPAVPGEQ